MRHSLAILLAFGIGITASTYVVVDQNGPGRACYKDGVVSSCTPPAPVYLGIGSSAEASARVSDANAVRRFRINLPEAALVDLRRRVVATRWPDRETVTDQSQGVPAAVTVFPGEIYRAPRSWAERAYPKLIYFHEVDKGGHFAVWEQPELFTAEIRAAFRSVR